MELNVLENKKNRLVLEISGVGHTFCNVLKKELWNDSDVKTSAYSIEHPLIGVPKIVVETKSKEAKKVLGDALGRLEKTNKEFVKAFSSVFK